MTKKIYEKLTVCYDKSDNDESAIGVFSCENGKTRLLTIRMAEEADVLYRLLTDQRAKIKSRSNNTKRMAEEWQKKKF